MKFYPVTCMLLSWLQLEFILDILYSKFFLLPYCHNTWSDVVLLTWSSVLLLAAGVPLMLHNVTTAINNVEWEILCVCLCVPQSKKDHIEQQASSAEHHRRMLAEWWLLTDPAPSWRRLIGCLDCCGDPRFGDDPSCAAAVDFIRHNAERVQGMLSTFISLFMCTHVITVWYHSWGVICHVIDIHKGIILYTWSFFVVSSCDWVYNCIYMLTVC